MVVFVSADLGGVKSAQCLIQLEGAIWKTVKCPERVAVNYGVEGK